MRVGGAESIAVFAPHDAQVLRLRCAATKACVCRDAYSAVEIVYRRSGSVRQRLGGMARSLWHIHEFRFLKHFVRCCQLQMSLHIVTAPRPVGEASHFLSRNRLRDGFTLASMGRNDEFRRL